MKQFGLIGKTLSHSFSKSYFSKKFEEEGLDQCSYENFELHSISGFPELIKQTPSLQGLNVTIPYKTEIIPFLTKLDPVAQRINAVNTIRFNGKELIGYNTDYYGFKQSVMEMLANEQGSVSALILGTGGASKAIFAALTDLKIKSKFVSSSGNGDLSYSDLNEEIICLHKLIVNTTPLGTFPNVDQCPSLPYKYISEHHFLYDLVYNPDITTFLKYGKSAGCHTKNGLQMLQLQAEKAWEIWNF